MKKCEAERGRFAKEAPTVVFLRTYRCTKHSGTETYTDAGAEASTGSETLTAADVAGEID